MCPCGLPRLVVLTPLHDRLQLSEEGCGVSREERRRGGQGQAHAVEGSFALGMGR